MKKTISILVIVAMLLSTFFMVLPIGAVEEAAPTLPITTWEKPWEQEGNPEGWIAIGTLEDFKAAFGESTNGTEEAPKKYYLTDDIEITGCTGLAPTYCTIDGNGHSFILSGTFVFASLTNCTVSIIFISVLQNRHDRHKSNVFIYSCPHRVTYMPRVTVLPPTLRSQELPAFHHRFQCTDRISR